MAGNLTYNLKIKSKIEGSKELKGFTDELDKFKKNTGKKTNAKVFTSAEKAIKDFDKGLTKSTKKTKRSLKDQQRAFKAFAKRVSGSLKAASQKFKSFGGSLSKYVTAPLLVLAGFSVRNFDKQAKSIAQVEAGLRSTGGAAGFTSDELQKLASGLQNKSLFGDEEILKDVTAQLLTFTSISGEAFAGTQEAALNLATRMGNDLKGASILLGKALNDPVTQLSALSRVGIKFSEESKKTIKTMVKTNNLAGAQALILKELEIQFGGSAAAAAKAGTGPLKQLSNSIGDLTEGFGKFILEAIAPFISFMKKAVDSFANLDEPTKEFIYKIGLAVAAIGPLLLVIGAVVSSMAVWALAGPGVSAALTGIGIAVKAFTLSLATMKGALIATGIGALVIGFGLLVAHVTKLTFEFGGFSNALELIGLQIQIFVLKAGARISSLGNLIKAKVKGFFGFKVEVNDFDNDALEKLRKTEQALIGRKFEMKMAISEKSAVNIKKDLPKLAASIKADPTAVVKLPVKFDINSLLEPVALAEAKAQLNNLSSQLSSDNLETNTVLESTGLDAIQLKAEQAQTALKKIYEDTGDSKALSLLNGIQQKLIDIKLKQSELSGENGLATTLVDDLGGVDAIAGKFTNMFSDAIDGTKSLGESFSGLVDNILQDLTRLALKKAITGAINSALGAATGGLVLGGRSASALVPSFSGGGPVFGAGTATSDSIQAFLSNGEYVIKASAVKDVGVDFLDRINNSNPSAKNKSNKYAEGGAVKSNNGAGSTKIEIINRGSEKEATKVQSRTEGRDTIVSVLINDLNTNGPIAQSFGSNFGVKR